jgi:glycosyltransferase involved in cell wall biosynthesis
MIRICTTLAGAGYSVILVGVSGKDSSPLSERKYDQKRLNSFFKKGFGFYAEYNARLFFYLLFTKADIICCIDLDTMLPAWLVGKLKRKQSVYDAHEYFSQQKEIVTRPGVFRVWYWIERTFLPKFRNGYTVNSSIAAEFKKKYGVDYEVIRNLPLLKTSEIKPGIRERIVLYQGAVNEARGLEFLIPAMKEIDAKLHIYGDGNFMEQTKSLIAANNLQHKVFLKGKVLPDQLDDITQRSKVGLNLVEHVGMNQYYSLANKFFDYINNGLPQVSMNFPEYKKINDEFEVAVLVDDLQPATLKSAIDKLLNDEQYNERLRQNCLKARQILNWQNEEKKLLEFYKNLS